MKIIYGQPGQRPTQVCEVDDDAGSFGSGRGVISGADAYAKVLALGDRALAYGFHVQLGSRLFEQCQIRRVEGHTISVEYREESARDD